MCKSRQGNCYCSCQSRDKLDGCENFVDGIPATNVGRFANESFQ